MATLKSAKKNDTIELRLPDQTKAAFKERCRQEGRTPSQALRTFIDEQIEPRRSRQAHSSLWRIAAAGAVGAVLGGGFAAPSIAASSGKTRPAFQELDRDFDGALTYDEYRSR